MPGAHGPLMVLVLAAGQGKRLRSKTIKLLHEVAGRPMVARVLDAAAALRPQCTVAVIGHQAEQIRSALEGRCDGFVVQREQRGTGHAVLQAARAIRGAAPAALLIVNGDLPTLRSATLARLLSTHRRAAAALTVLTTELEDATGYGRIVRDEDGGFQRIVEQRDATPAERRIREINCGLYCAAPGKLLAVLKRLRPDNKQGEYYLTDAVDALLRRGEKVLALGHDDSEEVLGVNTRQELAHAARTLYARKAERLEAAGVTLLDAERIWIDPDARIGRDTVIYPDVIVEGPSAIGKNCVVRPGCRLVNSRVGHDVEIKDYSLLFDSRVGNGVQIGPFAHLRPGSVLGANSRVGNFVELKKTTLGRGSKASHLAYLGDATIDADCNIGAGTITCNYDGEHKHPTTLGRRVFIGSDSQLIAPVRLHDDAYVAAGSTVTEDVPAGALAIARGRQRNVKGWVARSKQRKAVKARKAGKSRG